MPSIEEKVEEYYKKILDKNNIRHYGKTEKISDTITSALSTAESKSGGSGNNYPDIQMLLENSSSRRIPVMVEAKGNKNKLEKLDKTGEIVGVEIYKTDGKIGKDGLPIHKAGDKNYAAIRGYAVNGALHYGLAVLNSGAYNEVIVIGINGTTLDESGSVTDAASKAYYISKKNNFVPKHIKELDEENNWSLMSADGIKKLFEILDKLNFTEEEEESLRKRAEETLESKIKSIHQSLYDDKRLKTLLSTNEKLYLFCGLIMAGLSTEGVLPLEMAAFTSNDDTYDNDSSLITRRIRSFLKKKKCSDEKITMITGLLDPVFNKKALWQPYNGESIIKGLYKQVKESIIPCLESNLHLDFTGKILNSLNDWCQVENDRANDVVLTPRYVTTFMAKLAHTDKDSFVWDRAMGSAGFLVSAMDLMIKDAKVKILDEKELESKIKHIKENQLLGVEILGNIYILAVLNMILMGDGSSNVVCGNGHDMKIGENFPANVFLLNPPYSAEAKGLVFVEEALNHMTTGYACVLIQENVGAGQGGECAKRILKNNTLIASIHMPAQLFSGKASVQTSIFLWKIGRPHEKDDAVMFFDFSNDGYSRQNRKKSTQEVNLRDTNHAKVEALVLGKISKTRYYTEENGLLIKDTIGFNGDDWTYSCHKKTDIMPTQADFERTVSEYLKFRVGQILEGRA